MLNWYSYTDGALSVRLPKPLKKARAMPLFKGRIERRNPASEIIVVIDDDTPEAIVEAFLQPAALKPPPIKNWMGTTWNHRYRGTSVTRPGGVEFKVTQIEPESYGQGHRWNILFPVGAKWMYLDIQNAKGGLAWDEFEAIAKEIIESVQLAG